MTRLQKAAQALVDSYIVNAGTKYEFTACKTLEGRPKDAMTGRMWLELREALKEELDHAKG
jgi:hypothetical protein